MGLEKGVGELEEEKYMQHTLHTAWGHLGQQENIAYF